ncbi:MAG: hemolysin family protein [Candidatus Margulisiibacteriota bacterium]|jgi:putative hemolysin
MNFDLVILLVLLCFSAFFSAAETSLTTLGKAKLKNLVSKKHKSAKMLEKLLSRPGKLLATILVGNNLVNIAFSVIATTLFIEYIRGKININEASVTLLITLIVSFIILVFGEIIPKTVALVSAERFSLYLAFPVYLIEFILSPFVMIVNGFSRILIKLSGRSTLDRGQFITEEELRTLITIGREEGVLEEEEQQMLAGVFDLGDTVVREIMTPNVDMVSVNVNTPVMEVLEIVSEKGHSRLPVYEEKGENIVGVLNAKDLLRVALGTENSIRALLRPVQFVPETKKINELLKTMRTKRSHIAIVIDEHGSISGLVTIEDILEEIVGEINDEYDDEVEGLKIIKLDEVSYLVDASTNIYDLNSQLKLNIPAHDAYDTIGGFVTHQLGEIPKVKDKVDYLNLEFEITQAKKQRILQIKITFKGINEI